MTQRFNSLGREINIHVHKKTRMCSSTHNSPKLEIIQTSINRSMNKLYYFHTMELLIHATMWINFKNIKLSKIK